MRIKEQETRLNLHDHDDDDDEVSVDVAHPVCKAEFAVICVFRLQEYTCGSSPPAVIHGFDNGAPESDA